MRSVALRLLRTARPALRPAAWQTRSFSVARVARKEEFEMPELNQEQIDEIMKNPLISKLAQSPSTLEALHETAELLQKKGYTGEITMMKQVKLMMDSEIREKMQSLAQLLKDEGIELRQEDMAGLFKAMGLGEALNK